MACTGHTGGTEVHTCTCHGHTGGTEVDNCTCYGHSGTTETHSCTCHGHTNSCPSHGGYVPATTISFTNVNVVTGEVIDLQDGITELLSKLNTEATRRHNVFGTNPISLALDNPVEATELRAIRDLYLTLVGGTAASPITNTQIAAGQPILASTTETMKDGLVADAGTCQCNCNYCTCNCNYACTCNCNYACTCNCNYNCTCNCNYACTCNCNYACTCNCNYACTCNCNYCTCNCNYCTCNCNYCTCNCNYSCTCTCNYSDKRLKTNIIYF